MSVPTHLKHKPILDVRDYDHIDGRFAGETDAKALSLGVAQWNVGKLDPAEHDLSVKVWRSNGQRWSRQSEEVPLHRALDMATLVCVAMEYQQSDRNLNSPDAFPVSRSKANPAFETHVDFMDKVMSRDSKHLNKSLRNLRNALNRLEIPDE